MDGALITVPERPQVAADVAVSLKRLNGSSAAATYRPMWATDDMLDRMDETVSALLRPSGFTATAQVLDQVAALIPMPATEEGMQGYIERLMEYPLDVLARCCELVVRSHLSQKPPNVAVFIREASGDHLYQRRVRMRQEIAWLRKKEIREHAKPAKGTPEYDRVLAGFERLRGSA